MLVFYSGPAHWEVNSANPLGLGVVREKPTGAWLYRLLGIRQTAQETKSVFGLCAVLWW